MEINVDQVPAKCPNLHELTEPLQQSCEKELGTPFMNVHVHTHIFICHLN